MILLNDESVQSSIHIPTTQVQITKTLQLQLLVAVCLNLQCRRVLTHARLIMNCPLNLRYR